MHILSFDCANRSLAVCFASVNTNLLSDLTKAHDTKDVKKCVDLINSYVQIHILQVFDLTKGEKCTSVERALLLKQCLKKIDSLTTIKPDRVLIEYQMSSNDKSRCVSQQIVFHYSDIARTKISLVGPTLKNKICFSKDESLEHGTFMAKYASKYTANKNHSKSNFLYWLKIHNMEHLIKVNKIAKKNLDDIADAFMQIFGWLDFGKK